MRVAKELQHDDHEQTQETPQSFLASPASAKDRTLSLLPKARTRLARILVYGESDALRLIAALLALLYPLNSEPELLEPQWWWSVGFCTTTDKAELGGCGKLEVRQIEWRE